MSVMDGYCSAENCEEAVAYDMSNIILDFSKGYTEDIREDGTWFCSPSCALDCLQSVDESPKMVAVQDGQRFLDHTPLSDQFLTNEKYDYITVTTLEEVDELNVLEFIQQEYPPFRSE